MIVCRYALLLVVQSLALSNRYMFQRYLLLLGLEQETDLAGKNRTVLNSLKFRPLGKAQRRTLSGM